MSIQFFKEIFPVKFKCLPFHFDNFLDPIIVFFSWISPTGKPKYVKGIVVILQFKYLRNYVI